MANHNSRFLCSACGAQTASWAGRCPVCGEWNTLEVEAVSFSVAKGSKKAGRSTSLISASIEDSVSKVESRMLTKQAQLDAVFGGGVVSGSISLISGEPGIGKSTLLLSLAAQIAQSYPVLYVSGEESAHQVALRYQRMGLEAPNLQLASTNDSAQIADVIASKQYRLVIIDSIQTIKLDEISSAAGSVSQITNATALITQAAKQSNTAVVIVGHVTKEGSIAGPKLLEHLVDVVLYLEGDRSGGLKLLRAIKNRFGPTNETAIYEMVSKGLQPVENPSATLLAERMVTDGSVVLATLEGSRPLLVEVQALVNKTSYGYPKRAASGLDLARLNLLIAMMERRTSLKLSDMDVYINIVGGLKIQEPAADLAVVMAVASAARGKQLKDNAVVFGEVGLSGEVRHVPQIEKRLSEAKALGFNYAIGPKAARLKDNFLKPVIDVKTALNRYLS